jgi:hypothetical protein
VFLVNSRLGQFSATAKSFEGKPLHPQRHTFSRSYGVILPSSFTRNHSCALGFSPRLPVSVCGTDAAHLPRGFSRQHGITHFMTRGSRHHVSGLNEAADLPTTSPYTLEPPHPTGGWAILLRHPIDQTMRWRYRNINLLPIDYAFRPRLRTRLTLSGMTLLRKP